MSLEERLDMILGSSLKAVASMMNMEAFVPERHKETWGNNRCAVTFKRNKVKVTVIFDIQENKALVFEARKVS